MDLILVGLNHHTSPVELREKLAFSDGDAGAFLLETAADMRIPEALLLSTCNRTELYCRLAVKKTCVDDHAEFMRGLIIGKRADDLNPSSFYSYFGTDAARHLFRVAAGLDSMILGESQVLGQVKDAYRIACKHGTNGFLLNKLMHAAFRVGRRARSETGIATGIVSFSMAAVELSRKFFSDLGIKRALIIGAGEMAALTAEHFTSKGIGKLAFTNRTMGKAAALARKFGGAAAEWNNIPDAIAKSDIVVASTRAQNYLITADMLRQAMLARGSRPIFMIDMAVPRNIDPEAAKLDNVFIHNIDDLQQIIDMNLARRRAEVPAVEKIIEEEIGGLAAWYSSLSVTPTIKSLIKYAEDIRLAQIEADKNKFTSEQMESLDILTKSIVNKLLHVPIKKIRESAGDSNVTLYRVDAVRDIFDLTDETGKNED